MLKKTLLIRNPLLIILFCILPFLTNGCKGIWNPANVKDVPVNEADRRAKNVDAGKGLRLKNLGKGSGGDFQFASSNPMWRAAMEIVNFMPLSNADYSGGIIITDWYKENSNQNEEIKIMIRFLSNEIRADGVDITIHKRVCSARGIDCSVNKIKSELNSELKLSILRRASTIATQDKKKITKENIEKYGEYKVIK